MQDKHIMILNKPYEIEKTKYLYATNFYLFKHIGPGNENGADRFPQKYIYINMII